MPSMAIWGPKVWAVSPTKVLALEGLSFSYTQSADNNTSIEEEKTTNERGTELLPLSFTTVLHSGAGVDVWEEIKSWRDLVTHVYDFYLGGKKLGPKLQLRKVAVDGVKMDDLGRIRLATLSFEFKEYVAEKTNVPKTSTTGLNVKASTESKALVQNATSGIVAATAGGAAKGVAQNATSVAGTKNQVKPLETKTIKVGSYVKPTGKKYVTGEKIPAWVKQRSHRVSKIKTRENRVLLGHPNGINSWVYLNEITIVSF